MSKVEQISDTEYESLLNQYDFSYKKGDLIKGIVSGYSSEGVIIAIGGKTTAIVPEREARADFNISIEDTLKKDNEYEFLIIREEDDEGRFLLSYKKVAQAYIWHELEDLKNNNEIVEGVVINTVKGGVLVDVKGLRGFIPSSHMRTKDMNLQQGDKLDLKILTMDVQQNNFVLSNKLANPESENTERALLDNFETGQVVEGEIVRITDFGACVEIGGIDGLLPLSQISWSWVEHPSDVLKAGQKIKVEIIGIDNDKQRMSLSLKNLEKDPWVDAKNKIKEGEIVEGTVTRIKHFGAFIELYRGVEALFPNADVVEYQNKNNCIIAIGDKIQAKIVKFNPEDRRISLSV